MAAEHRGGGADHDDFSLRASSHAAPRRAGLWLDRLRHVRGTAMGRDARVSRWLLAQTHAPEHDVRKKITTHGHKRTHARKQDGNQ